MILEKGALVAVVDGEKLLMFTNVGDHAPHLSPLATPHMEEGRAGSGGHSSSSGNPDNDTQAEDGFAAGVAAMLNKRALAGEMTYLVVVAAPKTLGELRKHWHKQLEAKLVGEIAKDMTGQSAEEIAAAIAKV
ncbi:host attachment protein [Microvirga antarctica]|uniref:baeRF12 domain-containing protein n=1 Tax=Microvirga antarctica TaxID=2819233 RepID=UPI001B312C3A|nr:host attachment protein [Microvirga antarctica]